MTIVDGFLYSASAVSLRVITVIRKKSQITLRRQHQQVIGGASLAFRSGLTFSCP